MTKRIFEIHVDTGIEQDDKDITSIFIDLVAFMPMGVTFSFVKGNRDKGKTSG